MATPLPSTSAMATTPPSTSAMATPPSSTSAMATRPSSTSAMAGLAPPSTSPMATLVPPFISAMDADVLPSSSTVAASSPPTASAMLAPPPPPVIPGKVQKRPIDQEPRSRSKAPPSTSTMAVTGEARKKRPGHELPRSGCKKKKKIAAVQEEPAMAAKRASPRVASPKIVARSPGVNMLARSAALKRVSLAVSHDSAKRARSADQLETTPSQRLETPLQNNPSLEDLSPVARATSSCGPVRRRRKLISRIWKEVDPIYDGDLLVEGRCNHCQQVFPATRDTGSSHIRRHLEVCPMKIAMNEMVDKLGPTEVVDPNWKFDPKVSRRELVKLIVVNEMPFSLVEYKPFRDFAASLNPWFKLPSRTTAKDDCMITFKRHSLNMKQYLEESSSRVSLTADMWTSNQKLGYLCVTCHLIDSDWKIQKFVIRFFMMETPHNAINMYSVILKSIQDFNLEDKLFGFTLDNASVNTTMINHLRENLVKKGCLLLQGKLFHCRCAPHVFNLMVQDALLAMKSVVNNIRESVQYIRSSQSRGEKFQEIINQVGCFGKKPSIDVQTRWNSTYLMLQSAIPFRNAFDALGQQEKDYEFSPTPAEWKMAEAACSLLKVFYKATTLLSGSKYPTSHLYFPQLCNIKKALKRDASSKNTTIAHMVEQMEIKLEKYWKESYKSICVPVVFDPRFKFELLEYMLKDFGSETEANKWMRKLKKAIQKLFDEYSREIPVHHQQEDLGSPRAEEDEEEYDPLAEWDHYISCKKGQANNELDQYLKEELYPRKKELDILEWWKINSSKYPVLSRIARDILAISASTVPSESAFSSGGRIVSDYRSSLSCSTVEALICLQDWLRTSDLERFKAASLEPEEEDQDFTQLN